MHDQYQWVGISSWKKDEADSIHERMKNIRIRV